MRRLLLVSACLLAALAANPFETALANAGTKTVTLARSDAGTFSSNSRVRFTLAGVHWQGGGSVQLRTRSVGGRWSAWRPAAPEAEDGPRPGLARSRKRRVAHRQPVVDGSFECDRGARVRSSRARAGAARVEPGVAGPVPDAGCDRHAGDRPSARVERRRVDPSRTTELRVGRQVRDRPPHGGPERLHASRGRCDRPGNPALPRPGQRLERHRLQLSRRSLRDGVRGAVRRYRPERGRRTCSRLQHRLGRHRAPRLVLECDSVGRGPGCHRARDRLAARSRSRRPGVVPHLHLGRKRALCEWDPGPAESRLRPS